MTIAEEKRRLRQEVRALMQTLPAAYFARAGAEMTRRVLALPAYQAAGTVFGFVSHGREPDTHGLLRQALADGKRVCVPLCVAPGEMELRQVTDWAALRAGAYGIPEPPEDAPRVSPAEVDFAVIPCLCCTREGHRLGKGGGYYDRFLAGYRGARVMLCPERLLREWVPMEAHDAVVGMVVTEGEEG